MESVALLEAYPMNAREQEFSKAWLHLGFLVLVSQFSLVFCWRVVAKWQIPLAGAKEMANWRGCESCEGWLLGTKIQRVFQFQREVLLQNFPRPLCLPLATSLMTSAIGFGIHRLLLAWLEPIILTVMQSVLEPYCEAVCPDFSFPTDPDICLFFFCLGFFSSFLVPTECSWYSRLWVS